MEITMEYYLVISTIMLFAGIYGFITRRNMLAVLISIELILNSVDINFVAERVFAYIPRQDTAAESQNGSQRRKDILCINRSIGAWIITERLSVGQKRVAYIPTEKNGIVVFRCGKVDTVVNLVSSRILMRRIV